MTFSAFPLLLLVGVLANLEQTQLPQTEVDVVVYGATPGGFCAAIAAAREGAAVILLEPTDHVGGLITGGLSHCDSNQMVRQTVLGLFDEWHRRIVKDYTERGEPAPYDPSRKDQSRWTYEPHVAMRVTRQMLDEAGVRVLTRQVLTSVEKSGARITGLVTQQAKYHAKVFIDGTYEGDLMAAAGVSWTIGREGRDAFGESLAGKQFSKQTMEINGFDAEGKPLPLITATDAGPEAAGDGNVMTYSFRLCLTSTPENRIPMPQPDRYEPARFELVRRALQVGARVGLDLYPLPGRKFDGNNSIGGQFSLGLVGGGTQWHAADPRERQRIWEAHKQYTLEFFHFLTTDPAVPEQTRKKYAELGLCRDEFSASDHFSPALYVRESRRMKGAYVLSQKDILAEPEKSDPIAISSFPIDSHDCQRIALPGGGVINEGTIFPVRRQRLGQGYPYHVPYRSIVPRSEQCSNLLVPVALSCTHVGMSSLRIEGTWMVIGQSAGVAAALVARSGGSVQELDYPKLRERLLAQGQVLALPASKPPLRKEEVGLAPERFPGIILDDREAELQGAWSGSTNFKPYLGQGYRYSGMADREQVHPGTSTALFRFRVRQSGAYQLLMAYSAHPTRARAVPVRVTSGPHEKVLSVDQTVPLESNTLFRRIGLVDLKADVESSLRVETRETRGFVIVDAFQLLPVESRKGS